jgi:DNA polymerase-3 subunit epsilon
MRINHMIQLMKQVSGKIGSGIYASVQNQSNPQNVSFLRQLQKDAIREDELDCPFSELQVVVFDLETTGFFPSRGDQILSFGAIKIQGNQIQENDPFYSLVSVDQKVSEEITNLTGITQKDVAAAPPLAEVLLQFHDYIKNHLLVAHHSKHELAFMKHATYQLTRSDFQQRIVDTSFLIRIREPLFRNRSLEDCCALCDIDIKDRHNALGDARMTAQLWIHYVQLLQKQGLFTLRDVYEELSKIG